MHIGKGWLEFLFQGMPLLQFKGIVTLLKRTSFATLPFDAVGGVEGINEKVRCRRHFIKNVAKMCTVRTYKEYNHGFLIYLHTV